MRQAALALGLLAALAAGAMTDRAAAQDDGHHGRHGGAGITVIGQGSAAAAPDVAVIVAGVETLRPTAAASLAANNEAMTRAIAAVEDAGVAPEDRQTRNFGVTPVYARAEQGQGQALEGYRVYNELSVTLRNLDGIGGFLDALVSAGANRVGSIDFQIDDTTALMAEARAAAIADARRAAEAYAGAAGLTLGPVRRVVEVGQASPGPRGMMRAEAMVADAVPIEAGRERVVATVRVVFDVEGE